MRDKIIVLRFDNIISQETIDETIKEQADLFWEVKSIKTNFGTGGFRNVDIGVNAGPVWIMYIITIHFKKNESTESKST